MTPAPCNASSRRWQAEVRTKYRCIPMEERTAWGDPVITFWNIPEMRVCICKPGGVELSFRVNLRKDRPLSFTDSREE